MLASIFSENILAIATLLTALAGGLATIWSIISGRREKRRAVKEAVIEAEQKCHERLLVAHREAEKLSAELHDLKLRYES